MNYYNNKEKNQEIERLKAVGWGWFLMALTGWVACFYFILAN